VAPECTKLVAKGDFFAKKFLSFQSGWTGLPKFNSNLILKSNPVFWRGFRFLNYSFGRYCKASEIWGIWISLTEAKSAIVRATLITR
jgi:hypothetical protein